MRNALPLPKVLYPVAGKPMIQHCVDALKNSMIIEKPIVVVPSLGDEIKQELGAQCQYAVQDVPRGTAHALIAAESKLRHCKTVIVLYGDTPFITSRFINELLRSHTAAGAPISMTTTIVPDFQSWRDAFQNFGRVLRDERGRLIRIVESKDATLAEERIKELNAGYYAFETEWLLQNLLKIRPNNTQGEYYLTDLVAMAIEAGDPVNTVMLQNPEEAFGINTADQWRHAEDLITRRSNPNSQAMPPGTSTRVLESAVKHDEQSV